LSFFLATENPSIVFQFGSKILEDDLVKVFFRGAGWSRWRSRTGFRRRLRVNGGGRRPRGRLDDRRALSAGDGFLFQTAIQAPGEHSFDHLPVLFFEEIPQLGNETFGGQELGVAGFSRGKDPATLIDQAHDHRVVHTTVLSLNVVNDSLVLDIRVVPG